MDREKIVGLLGELEEVLSDEQRQGRIPSPAGTFMVLITPESIEANEEHPTLRRSLEITERLLELCPGSRGVKNYLLEIVDTWTRLGMPASQILSCFGVDEGKWELFDADAIRHEEAKFLEADARALFLLLLGSLMIMIPDDQVDRVNAEMASAYFENLMLTDDGRWMTADELRSATYHHASIIDMWAGRFEHTRRILNWVDQYVERYGEPPAGLGETERRMRNFLKYAPQ